MRLTVALHNFGTALGRNLMGIGLMLFCAMSITMNGWFGWQVGAVLGPAGSVVSALGFSGAEIIKYGCAWWIGEHWANSRSRLASTVLILAGVTVISFQAQIGFIGTTRGDTAAGRASSATLAVDASASLTEDRADLARLKATPRYASSRSCSNATAEQSIALCERVVAIEARLAAAAGLVEARGTVGTGDPVVSVLLWFWPRDERTVGLGIAMIIAGINEIVTALGWFAAGRSVERGGGLGPSPLKFDTDQSASVERLIKIGAIAHPALKDLLAFRLDRLEQTDGHWLTGEVVYLDYMAWVAARRQDMPLGAEVFHRLFSSLVKKHPAGGYTGWRIRQDVAALEARSA